MPNETLGDAAGQDVRDILDSPLAGPAVIRGGALRAAAYVAGFLLSAVTTPLLVRHLGVADFGRYVTVSSIILIAGALTDAGLTNIGIREYSIRPASERDWLMRNLLGMRLALTSAAILLATAFSFVVSYPRVVVAGTFLMGLGLMTTVLQGTFSVPLSYHLRLGWISVLEFLRQSATVVLVVILVLAGATLLPFYTTPIAGGLMALVLTIPLARRDAPLRPAVDLGEWWLLVRDGLAYAAASAVGVIYFRIEVVLLSLIATARQTGYYGTSFRIVEVVAGVPFLANLSAFPILARSARDDRARFNYQLQRIFEVSTVTGVWIAILLGVGAEFAVHVVAGKGFGPSIPVLRILGVSMAASFVLFAGAFALLALKRHAELLAANGIALATAVGLTLALAPSSGAKGAAIATAVTEFVLAGTYAVMLLRREHELQISAAVVPKVLLAGGVAVAAAVIPPFPSSAAMVVATAVYFAILLPLRGIPDEVLHAFGLRRGSR